MFPSQLTLEVGRIHAAELAGPARRGPAPAARSDGPRRRGLGEQLEALRRRLEIGRRRRRALTALHMDRRTAPRG